MLADDASGRTLQLNDVFSATGKWVEQRYDVADQSGVFAAGATVECTRPNSSDTSNIVSLELRLANRFSALAFRVGQSNSSGTSEGLLNVDVVANGVKKDNRDVAFNKLQDFNVDVRDVGAVKIAFTLPCPENYSGDGKYVVDAVVAGMTVTAAP